MSFDYEMAKEFFFRKMEADRVGKHRMESALYHTAAFVYAEGCKDADRAKDARIAELEKLLSITEEKQDDQSAL